ncbi:MAG: transposase [Tissierellia bacterium]|nr:transposase [Tissierellia bacterium]
MIRLFSKLCKCFKQISFENEINIFDKYIESFNADDLICPYCGSKHALTPFASYRRHLVTYNNNETNDNIITIYRYICSSCGHTHAILPSIIIPYSSFSFKFVVYIIHDYLVGKFNSVEAMCKHYGIAISSFYRLLKKFKEHKKLWLGLLEDKLTSSLDFIQNLKNYTFTEIETFIINFFKQNGLSCFQGKDFQETS